MKIYISGPITGLPIEEYTASFKKAKIALMAKFALSEKHIFNPVEDYKPGLTWIEYMEYDLEILRKCMAIYMLNGWRNSNGARIEHKFAQAMGKFIYYESGEL